MGRDSRGGNKDVDRENWEVIKGEGDKWREKAVDREKFIVMILSLHTRTRTHARARTHAL